MRTTNRRLLLIVGTVTVVLGLAAAAQRLAPTPSTVAVVDLGKVFNNLESWTVYQDEKIQMAEAAQAETARQRSDIEDLQADLEDFPESSERHRDALRALQLAAIEFEANLQFREERLQRFESRRIRDIYEAIRTSAAEFAKSNGYSMVLVDDGVEQIPENAKDPISMISSRRVLYAEQTMDISDALTEAMNVKHRAGGGS